MPAVSQSLHFFSYATTALITLLVLSKMLSVLMPTAQVAVLAASVGSLNASSIEKNYHAPGKSALNDLDSVLAGSGIHGFIFNTSQTPSNLPYSTYNWCNMPHIRKDEYILPPPEYELRFVELIHRHHKRTPYYDNLFPKETERWDCGDIRRFQYAQTLTEDHNESAPVYQHYAPYTEYESTNPFRPAGFPPHTCAYPQITQYGLDDSHQHGKDIYGVYHDLLRLIPDVAEPKQMNFRVTNNPITSQVAGMVIGGMFGESTQEAHDGVALRLQPSQIDSLEPDYPCPKANELFASFAVGSSDATWQKHLDATSHLRTTLNRITGVNASDEAWSKSFDHYFDNLSFRLCHQLPLPCDRSVDEDLSPECRIKKQADNVFRLGEWEYAWQYRAAGPDTLRASAASFGVWVSELVNDLSSAAKRDDYVKYKHNVAHDGSIARLLSILQAEDMVWPGMGSELVFELWQRKSGDYFVRILWSGQPFKSSAPSLQGDKDYMIPLDRFIAYVEDLVGHNAAKVRDLCDV